MQRFRRVFSDLDGISCALAGPFVRVLSRHTLVSASLVFAAALLVLVGLCPPYLGTGDAIVYAQQIAARDFTQRTVHVAYIWLGVLLDWISPLDVDYTLNLGSALFGALSAAMLYLLAVGLFDEPARVHHAAGRLSSVVLLTIVFGCANFLFLYHALHAEVYTPQVFFLLLALLCWMRGWAVMAGIGCAAAFLLSPHVALAVPLFVLLRPRLRPLLVWSATGLLLCAPVILVLRDDFLFSPRGLIGAGAAATSTMTDRLRKEAQELLLTHVVFLPLLIAGAWTAWYDRRWRLWTMAIFALWSVMLLVGDKFPESFPDVPVQLPTYCLLGSLGALGWRSLCRTTETWSAGAKPLWRLAAAVPALLPLLVVPWLVAVRRGADPVQLKFLWAWVTVVGGVAIVFVAVVLTARRERTFRALLRVWLALALATNVGIALLLIAQRDRTTAEQVRTARRIGAAAVPGDLVIAEWGVRMTLEYYAFGRSYTEHGVDARALSSALRAGRESSETMRLDEALALGRTVWLFGEFPAIRDTLRNAGLVVASFRDGWVATKAAAGPQHELE